jgi:tRNA pseudouridine55 synthase
MNPPFHGLLVLDKPGGLTSRDVVNRVQRCFPRGTRIGHTGTLDPLATGVLVVCVGAATRLTEYVQQMDKVYHARLELDARSDTDDADGTIERLTFAEPPPDRESVAACLQEFVGEIEQVPPAYSAAKLTGQRAYDLARRGETVSLKPRRVQVYGIHLQAYDYPYIEIRVHCGKGTYIRSLARDLGERLGRGAYVQTLRRTRVGPFEEGQSLGLEMDAATARSRLLLPAAAVAQLPRVCLDAAALARFRQGLAVPSPGPLQPDEGKEVAVFDDAGSFAGVAVADCGRRLTPAKVFVGT